MSTPPRWASCSMCWGGDDDPGSERRAGLAGDRIYRHEERLWEPRSSRAGDVEARSLRRRSFYFSRTPRRPRKNRLARRSGRLPIHKKIETGPLHLAFHRRWRCDDQHRSDGLSSRRNRLANAASNLASAGSWIKLWLFDQACCLRAIFVIEYGCLDPCQRYPIRFLKTLPPPMR